MRYYIFIFLSALIQQEVYLHNKSSSVANQYCIDNRNDFYQRKNEYFFYCARLCKYPLLVTCIATLLALKIQSKLAALKKIFMIFCVSIFISWAYLLDGLWKVKVKVYAVLVPFFFLLTWREGNLSLSYSSLTEKNDVFIPIMVCFTLLSCLILYGLYRTHPISSY